MRIFALVAGSLATAFAITRLCSVGLASPRSNSRAALPSPSFPLEISPEFVVLGLVKSGQSTEATVNVTNRRSHSVAVERVETSCPCLTLVPSSFRMMPGETQVLAIRFDTSSEGEFRGDLGIEITGYAAENVLFRGRVKVRVETETSALLQPFGGAWAGRVAETGGRPPTAAADVAFRFTAVNPCGGSLQLPCKPTEAKKGGFQ